MGVHIDGNELLITKEPKIIHFDLHNNVNNSLNQKINSVIK